MDGTIQYDVKTRHFLVVDFTAVSALLQYCTVIDAITIFISGIETCPDSVCFVFISDRCANFDTLNLRSIKLLFF